MKLAATFFGAALFGTALLLAAEDSAPLVVRAPDHLAGPISPGEIVILHPPDLGPAVLTGAQLDAAGNVTTSLGGIRVLFDGQPAPLAYAVSGDIMAIVPYEIAGKHSTQLVIESQGAPSAPSTLDVVDSTPALFTLDSTGRGQAAVLNELGCCNSVRNPAKRSSVITLYATGEGQTVPAGITGAVSFYNRAADYPVPRLPLRLSVGGEPAEIVWAGEAPHAVTGLFQVNFRVPANAPLGDAVPLTLSIGEASSPSGVTIAIRCAQPHILLIDPNPVTRDWFRTTLEAASFEISTARNAGEAIEQTSGPVDLIVFSLDIPAPDRLETLRVLQPGRPHIALTALGTAAWLSPAMLKAADSFGAQAVFIQPLSAKAVVERIRRLLTPHGYPD